MFGPIGRTRIDNCFTDLERDENGRASVDLADSESGRALTLWVDARYGYLIQKYALDHNGNCSTCGTHLPGRWSQAFAGQRTSTPFLPHDRSRLSVI